MNDDIHRSYKLRLPSLRSDSSSAADDSNQPLSLTRDIKKTHKKHKIVIIITRKLDWDQYW